MFFYHKISEQLSNKLNIARAIAAILVMLIHLRASLFVPYNQLDSTSLGLINSFLFLITRLGRECVLVFFVLSGFLVGGQLVSEFINEKFAVKKYFVNRLSRMWLVVIPALFLGWLVDYQTLTMDPTLDFAHKLTLPIFIGNVFFTQTILVPSFGSNVPLWSLASEFWYYLIFPLFVYITRFNFNFYVKIIVVLSFTALFSIVAPHIMKLFPIWLLGVAIRFIPKHAIYQRKYTQIILLFTFFLVAFISNYKESLFGDYVVSMIFSLNLLCWMYRDKSIQQKLINNIFYKLSEFSFSLYAIHYFIIGFIVALLQKNGYAIRFKQAEIFNWSFYLFIAIVIMLIGYVFYLLFEKHTFTLRKLFSRFLF